MIYDIRNKIKIQIIPNCIVKRLNIIYIYLDGVDVYVGITKYLIAKLKVQYLS